MSGESPRRVSRSGGITVRPQPACDKSVLESVVDFFQDVVPQAYIGTQKSDDKEKIQWVKFEQTDVNDITANPDVSLPSGSSPPLLLVLGYVNGVQVWIVTASGESHEVLSLRQGPVRVLRVLSSPEPVFEDSMHDAFESKRPLVALSDGSSPGQPYCSVKLLSLKTGDEVHSISFPSPVFNIQANKRVMVVGLHGSLSVFDTCRFCKVLTVTNCYPSKGPDMNPVALGTRWLAYADQKLVPMHQSCGGMTGDGAQSYAATMINAAKTITKGLQMFGETVTSSLTGNKPVPHKKEPSVSDPDHTPGIVTIIDIQKIKGEFCVADEYDGEGILAHFPAHASEPVSALSFDPSGILLFTACRLGQNFHIFRIMAHPWSSSMGAVHHLYTLHRGDTTAKVQDVTFTMDSRWVAVSTLRGTTHLFPMTTYGGPITVRTHTSPRVVNRSSRFHRSAGLDDIEQATGRHSPVTVSGSPGGSNAAYHEHYPTLLHQNALNNNSINPRLPPYPHPTTMYPLVQIKQPLTLASISGGPAAKSGQTPGSAVETLCVAAAFGPMKGWVAGAMREKGDAKRAIDSLYVFGWGGSLIEYVLDVKPKPGIDKISDEAPIEVTAVPRAQWNLQRSIHAAELKPPLSSNNQLILATDAVLTQQPSSSTDYPYAGLVQRVDSESSLSSDHSSIKEDMDDQWLSQVEIITHAGPHRRLWMGPQFSFKTFQNTQNTTTVLSSNSSVLLSQSPETQITTTDILSDEVDLQSLPLQPTRSSPVAMPGRQRAQRGSTSSDTYSPTPVFSIEAGSFEQSPNLVEVCGSWPEVSGQIAPALPTRSGDVPEESLCETLADAMIESPQKDGRPQDESKDQSKKRGAAFDLRSSPVQTLEHVLVFPSNNSSDLQS
ncbi:LOW QUALITY PROTEIN: breast carcinoma-amplified sequence 3-like [Lingula anatina]|uniref:LOW QUALITY PROTEIN: breast carcinoma-amplified sequence 3-like n=1 Tax=Lingula anatina TaxID=7574 RepID=A0A1S3H1T2_LINAN|nr:LOW QUALITY PROTEIN: breast carcinoma-amplified sequence 3-like [Lingula anatina]|eukprot:XP_013379441.1 LOW QUALITY PROTEIN: breast carcinoma-amplified sequence 3-like [Lingula anatina]